MFSRSVLTMTFVGVLGSGLVAGVFFAFSTFVMPALARLRAEQGIAAMQSINITVITPAFMLALFGTAIIALVLGIGSIFRWSQPGSLLTLAASVLYLIGGVGVTLGGNVPLNTALATVQGAGADGVAVWTRFLHDWTLWNHVRTAASAGSCALYLAAIALR
jgi:uncharacterized membrane protein